MEKERRPANRNMIYTLLFSFAGTIVAVVVCIVYVGYVDNQNKHNWCSAVVAIDDAFRTSSTPQSSAGKKIAEAYGKLRNDFEC